MNLNINSPTFTLDDAANIILLLGIFTVGYGYCMLFYFLFRGIKNVKS